MKKKLLMSAFVLVISVAMVAAATMAWFTDSDDAGEATFEAGTVSIEAGRKIYEDDSGGAQIIEGTFLPARVSEYNQGKTLNESNVLTKRSEPKSALELDTDFFSLGFDGFIILEFDHAIYSPTLVIVVEETGGTYPEETADIFVSMTGKPGSWVLVDEATNKSEKYSGNRKSNEFENIDNIPYVKYVKVVDTTDRNNFKEGDYSGQDPDGFDLNTVQIKGTTAEEENWNPGETDYRSYTIINTGTKSIKLRGKLTGSWHEFVDDDNGGSWVPSSNLGSDNVEITPVGDNWRVYGNYLYYQSDIQGTYAGTDERERTVELKVKVHLKGNETVNEYQGKRFIITAEFEAIQASNDASVHHEDWVVDIDALFNDN